MITIPEDADLQDPTTIPIKKCEAREQARLVAALRRHWNSITPCFRPIVFAVPNGGSRDAREATSLKTQGVLAGMPDLIILAPGPVTVFVEMKAPDGRVSQMQAQLHPQIRQLGYEMIVAYSAEEALQELRKVQWTN